jgi:hypothetical protein
VCAQEEMTGKFMSLEVEVMANNYALSRLQQINQEKLGIKP